VTRWSHSTIRVRLTLHYAVTFFVAGAIIVTFTYVYLRHSLDQQLAERIATTEQLATDMLGRSHGDHGIGQLHEALRAQFQQERDDMLATTLIWSLVALGVVGLLAGGVGWLMAGRALHPLQRITATARRVADRSLHERIALRGPADEIKDLADTFDAMLERLDRAFDGQRRFVANASHELRTPLTINRTLIQVALDTPDTPQATRELGATLLEVNHRHERLIDGLLMLATSDQHLTEHSPVDLADPSSAPRSPPPPSRATRSSWSVWCRTCSTTPSATTSASTVWWPSPPAPATGTPTSPSRTPAPPSPPTRSTTCSSPSAGSARPTGSPIRPRRTAGPVSVCPSSARSPTPTTVRCAPTPAPAAASQSSYDSRPTRRVCPMILEQSPSDLAVRAAPASPQPAQ
jgi:HAMP domain-containing protein